MFEYQPIEIYLRGPMILAVFVPFLCFHSLTLRLVLVNDQENSAL